jgi:hypothetical protein
MHFNVKSLIQLGSKLSRYLALAPSSKSSHCCLYMCSIFQMGSKLSRFLLLHPFLSLLIAVYTCAPYFQWDPNFPDTSLLHPVLSLLIAVYTCAPYLYRTRFHLSLHMHKCFTGCLFLWVSNKILYLFVGLLSHKCFHSLLNFKIKECLRITTS